MGMPVYAAAPFASWQQFTHASIVNGADRMMKANVVANQKHLHMTVCPRVQNLMNIIPLSF
jgi:hypothetical protein